MNQPAARKQVSMNPVLSVNPEAGETPPTLAALFDAATAALAMLDAGRIERLAESLAESLADSTMLLPVPRTAAEWERTRQSRWVLGRLLGETGGRLEMLRRVGDPEAGWAAGSRRRPRLREDRGHAGTGTAPDC